MTVRGILVYRKAKKTQTLIGEVLANSAMIMKQFRENVATEMGLKDGFTLERSGTKGKIPINERQDHHLVLDFFRSDDDVVVVTEP